MRENDHDSHTTPGSADYGSRPGCEHDHLVLPSGKYVADKVEKWRAIADDLAAALRYHRESNPNLLNGEAALAAYEKAKDGS